jgi:hypothetical protein
MRSGSLKVTNQRSGQMAIDFPDTPITGDTHTVGSKTWRYDGEKWQILNESANQQNQLYDIMVLMNMETN